MGTGYHFSGDTMMHWIQRFVLHTIVFTALIPLGNTGELYAQEARGIVTYPTLGYVSMGHYLMAPVEGSTIAFVDHAGYVAHGESLNACINLQQSGNYLTNYDIACKGLVVRDANLNPIDTVFMANGYRIDWHECYRLPNGNFILLGFDTRQIDMSAYVPGGHPQAEVDGAVIQELSPTGALLFEWRSLDHILPTDATRDIDLTQKAIDYIHINAVFIDSDNNYLISCRHTDEVIKVSRTTGAILWRLGGKESKHNQFEWLNDSTDTFYGFSHQHGVNRLKNGNILMFDNGNLKPTTVSRAVEYKIDEINKTIEAVWSYEEPGGLFTSTMGSAVELANSNILISWGAGNGTYLASEVTRDGVPVMHMKATEQNIQSYRVYQSLLKIAGKELSINGSGTYVFNGDSATHVTVIAGDGVPTKVSVERFNYAPHQFALIGLAPCTVLPIHWMIRTERLNSVNGKIEIDIKKVSGVLEYSKVKVLRRDVEGEGNFMAVASEYNATTGQLTIGKFSAGEYCLVFDACANPSLLVPSADQTQVGIPTHFVWGAAVETDGYDVEVYKNGQLATAVWSGRIPTGKTDTTINILQNSTRYQWRVRARRSSGVGDWTTFAAFTTSSQIPVISEPMIIAGSDTVAVDAKPLLRWSGVPTKNQYRVQVFTLPDMAKVTDTLVSGTSMTLRKTLAYHQMHQWIVRVEEGTSVSAYSEPARFITKPEPPVLVWLVDGEVGVNPVGVNLQWTGPTGFRDYHVYTSIDTSQVAFWQDTVRSYTATLPNLPYDKLVKWSVRTVGKYGPSAWATVRQFKVMPTPALNPPFTSAPRNNQTTEATDTKFTWTSVSGATAYTVEVSTSTSFNRPDVTLTNLKSATTTITTLKPGLRYYWRVSASSSQLSGLWSDTASFQTTPKPGAELEALVPADGATDVPVEAIFQFVTNAKFDNYRVEIAKDMNFSSIEAVVSGTTSPLTLHLPSETSLYWRVIGMSGGADVDTSAYNQFTTEFIVSVDESLNAENIVVHQNGSSIAIFTRDGSMFTYMITALDGSVVAVKDTEVTTVDHNISGMSSGTYILIVQQGTKHMAIPFQLVH